MEGLVKHYLAAVPVSGFLLGMHLWRLGFVGLAFAVDLKALKKDHGVREAVVMLHYSVR